MTVATPLPKVIGATENALRANLLQVLGRAGLTMEDWIALQLTCNSSDGPTRDEVLVGLRSAAKVEADAAVQTLRSLEADGWLRAEGDRMRLGERGARDFPALREESARRTRAFVEGITEEEHAIVERVLRSIATRASEELTRSEGGER